MTNKERLLEAFDRVKRVYVASEHYDEEDINILQELVDKAIPKKIITFYSNVTNSEDVYAFDTCPSCRKYLNLNQKYCDECTQALDWSDEYDE